MIGKIKLKLLQDKHLTELVSSSVISFGLRVLGIGFGYLFILLMSRQLGASAVGVFTLSFTVLQIVSIIGRFGLDTALLRFVSESASQDKLGEATDSYTKAAWFAFFVSAVLCVATYFFAPVIADAVFKNTALEWPFQVISLGIVPMTLTFLNYETLRAMKLIRAYAFFQNVSMFMLASLILSILIILVTITGTEVVGVFVAAVWLTWIMSQLRVTKAFKRYARVSGRKLGTMLKTAFPMMIASSLMLVMGWTDTIMIGMFMDESSVGVFSVALKVATVTSITLMAINSMAAPRFAEFYAKNDMVSLQRVVRHASRLIFWTSLPILFISVIFPEFILGIFGEEFKVAAWTLIILCIGQFVNAASGSVGYILQMTGREAIFQKIVFFSLGINIILNYFLIPLYGINGAALASMTSMIVWNLSAAVYIAVSIKIYSYYVPNIFRQR